MNQVPIPPELVPQGAELSPTGMSYTDAWALPIEQPPAQDGAEPAPGTLAVIRFNHLFQATPDEARLLVSNGWHLWLRTGPPIAGGSIVRLEPMVPLLRPPPFLDSDVPDPQPPTQP